MEEVAGHIFERGKHDRLLSSRSGEHWRDRPTRGAPSRSAGDDVERDRYRAGELRFQLNYHR